ncbi:hypothetical protein [Pontibacter beigongshangensis]|uniref:hypothetical protein n=1 Tax=Pontibacter beigongshangensis TaxID=2574733 RepID=UPI00164F1AD9|nr:hypothetical protein [Pontibacter beigongshangensis]
METNNYDRERLLREALQQEDVTMASLEEALGLREQEILCQLYGEQAEEHIRRVCRILKIDQGYFSGQMHYEGGSLVRRG